MGIRQTFSSESGIEASPAQILVFPVRDKLDVRHVGLHRDTHVAPGATSGGPSGVPRPIHTLVDSQTIF